MLSHLADLYKAMSSPKETMLSLLQDKYHIALVCEVCRLPDEDKRLWYEVREPRETVGQILPLARAGLGFACGLNKVSALGRIFGLPTPVLNDSTFAVGREFLHDLERKGLSDYEELQKLVEVKFKEQNHVQKSLSFSGAEVSIGETGYCLREFSRFLREHDPDEVWARLSPRVTEKGDLCFVCRSCLGNSKP
jgi:hypothetical protein